MQNNVGIPQTITIASQKDYVILWTISHGLLSHCGEKANTSHIVNSNTIIFSIAYSTSVTANKTRIICATNLLYCLYKGWSRLQFLKALSILTGKPAMDNDFQNPFLLPFLYHISLTNLFKN